MGKKSLIYKIITIIVTTLLIIALGSFIYTLLLFNGIENFYRIMLSIILIVVINLIVGTLIVSLKKNKKILYIVFTILSIILSCGFVLGSYYLFTAYSKLSDMNIKTVTHETALLSKNKEYNIKKLKDTKIGIISDTENIEGYILAKELLEKYNVESNNEIVEYSDSLTLMNALYSDEVDLILMSSNYVDLFAPIEGYENIAKEVFVIEKYGKDYKKSEVEEDKEVKTNLTEPISILLMGIDSEIDGLSANASFNGDTIMLITFDPKTLNATMFSIPRDTYVTMACGGSTQKINHAAWGGTNCMVKTVTRLTGIDIDYYFKINFKGVVDLVNALGGITVDVPVPDYPKEYCLEDSNRVYKNVCLTPGIQKLDGEHALALARVRKAFALGDFQRGQNQQLVVEGLMQEIKNVRSVNKFYEILDVVSKNIDTNMTTDEMLSFYNVGKSLLFSNDNNVINIQKTWLRGYSLYLYEPSGGNYTYTFQYYKGSLTDIVNAMKINLGLKQKEVIKKLSFSINEPYEKRIIGDKTYREGTVALIPDFTNGYTLDGIKKWGTTNSVNIIVEEITEGNMFNSAYPDGKIVGQSVHKDSLVQRANGTITIYVIKNEVQNDTNISIENENPKTEEDNNEIIPDPVVPGIPEIPETPDQEESNENEETE